MGYDGFTKTVNTSINNDFLHNTFLMKNDTFSPFCMWRTAPNTRQIHLLFHIPKRIGNMFTTLFWQNIITHIHTHVQRITSTVISRCPEAPCLTSFCSPRMMQVSWVLCVTSASPMRTSKVCQGIKMLPYSDMFK